MENILSTESISPQAFYAKRKFGYQSFQQLKELETMDCLLLFSRMPSFSIDNEGMQSYPMVLEIDDKEMESKAQKIATFQDCHIYACADTIHITPTNCRLLFFSDEARILAHLKCQDSLLCKMAEYFHFETVANAGIPLQGIIDAIDKEKLPSVGEASENQYDHVKGFVYGFALGYLQSLPADIARMRAIQIRTNEIVAAIVNHGRSNDAFNTELRKLDEKYAQLDPEIKKTRKAWEDWCGASLAAIEERLKELGLEPEAKNRFCKKQGLNLRQRLGNPPYLDASLVTYNNDMKRSIDLLFKEAREANVARMNICTQLDIDPSYATAMLSGEDGPSMAFNKILANIIWEEFIHSLDDLRIYRPDIAADISKKVCEMATADKVSQMQEYFQHLCANIRAFQPFCLSDIDDVALQSLAAFILKGDDYKDLISYLDKETVAPRQYALAMWGAVNGYVKISRPILSCLSKEEKEKLYRDAYYLMARKELKGQLTEYVAPPLKTTSEPMHKSEDLNETKQEDWQSKLWKLVCEILKNFKKGKKDAETEAKECMDGSNSLSQFLEKLKKCSQWITPKGEKPNKRYKKLKELIEQDKDLAKEIKQPVSRTLFGQV